MKSFVLVPAVAGILLFASTVQSATTYGRAVTVPETTKVSQMLDNPARCLGREVKVEGMIVEVCAKRGCWVELASDRQYEKLRMKVDDGVVVFPLSARGRKARVQDKVEDISMSVEEARRFFAHKAEEKGTSFDPSSITEPVSLYQIRASGAIID